MTEEQKINNIISRLPGWMKNPYLLTGAAIVVIVALYFLMPFLKTMDSPFTEYDPLPIDSTYIKLDTSATKEKPDSLTIKPDTIRNDEIEEKLAPTDSTSVADLFKLNTDYQELDPNEQLDRSTEEEPDDIFSQLVLSKLEPSEIKTLNEISLNVGIRSILQMLSTTAIEILTDVQTKYHLSIIEAMEMSPVVQGIIISDRSEKIQYATNKKFKSQYLFDIFPRNSLTEDKLVIQQMNNLRLISLPVHHQYGKIGTIILIIEE
ncbi:MAG: hypothetical protein HKN68_03325 [Saprospiraceae bacterium]|nr:hypothetical protein [Saprospiraceae bacterium]